MLCVQICTQYNISYSAQNTQLFYITNLRKNYSHLCRNVVKYSQ